MQKTPKREVLKIPGAVDWDILKLELKDLKIESTTACDMYEELVAKVEKPLFRCTKPETVLKKCNYIAHSSKEK